MSAQVLRTAACAHIGGLQSTDYSASNSVTVWHFSARHIGTPVSTRVLGERNAITILGFGPGESTLVNAVETEFRASHDPVSVGLTPRSCLNTRPSRQQRPFAARRVDRFLVAS